MTITSERVEALRRKVSDALVREKDMEAAEQDDYVLRLARLVDLDADEVATLLDAYQNQQADHTCHDHCQRTECVLRRERDALVEGVREYVKECQKEADDALSGESGGMALLSVARDLTAILARVEGERLPEQGEG